MERSKPVRELVDLGLLEFEDLVYLFWVTVEAGLVKRQPVQPFVAIIDLLSAIKRETRCLNLMRFLKLRFWSEFTKLK